MIISPADRATHHALGQSWSLLQQADDQARALFYAGMRKDELKQSIEVTALLASQLAHHGITLLPSKDTLNCKIAVDNRVEDGTRAMPAATINIG